MIAHHTKLLLFQHTYKYQTLCNLKIKEIYKKRQSRYVPSPGSRQCAPPLPILFRSRDFTCVKTTCKVTLNEVLAFFIFDSFVYVYRFSNMKSVRLGVSRGYERAMVESGWARGNRYRRGVSSAHLRISPTCSTCNLYSNQPLLATLFAQNRQFETEMNFVQYFKIFHLYYFKTNLGRNSLKVGHNLIFH